MNILVIGSGGREHALCWAIAKSPRATKVFCAPGNGGIADVAECIALNTAEHGAVIDFCNTHAIKMVVVGPEQPLVEGLADSLRKAGIATFGPSAAAAQLEGSKGFTKDLCARHNIPTAAYGRFDNGGEAKAFIAEKGAPIVIKADGLAAGKGVIIAMTMDEAIEAVDDIFGGAFGSAGAEVVVEEFLEGEEASFFVLVDGDVALPLVTAQDHKRVGDGDIGPNTGGMGAYSPAPIMSEALIKRTMDEIITPTVKGMVAEGTPYQGVLFAGLMITDKGPELIEYNARFGDPECQVLMMRLDTDAVDMFEAATNGTLDSLALKWKSDVALTVVLAAEGYPGSYQKGSEIKGLDALKGRDDVHVFHAGTKTENGKTLAIGGRVLNVTALGSSVKDAQHKAYAAVDQIDWPQGFCRRDIGWRAIEREEG